MLLWLFCGVAPVVTAGSEVGVDVVLVGAASRVTTASSPSSRAHSGAAGTDVDTAAGELLNFVGVRAIGSSR